MILRIVCGVLAAFFVVCALLQLNDPDPVGWTAIYACAALCSGLASARRLRWPLAAAVGLSALAWAASFGWGVITGGMLRDLARAMGPGTHAEEAREFMGLCIVVACMSLLVIVRRRVGR